MEKNMNLGSTKRDVNTKQRILEIAINLFAEKDYSSVSIREIAKEVGIKGSSIYNHFKSKEDIIDAILDYHMEASNSVFDGYFEMPKISYEAEHMSLEVILLSSMLTSMKFMELPNMDKIFKILSKEQLNNDKIRSFFLQEYIIKPREELEKVFEELIKKNMVKYIDSKQLAAEFHSYVIYKFYENYMLRRDKELDFEAMKEDFGNHIKFFGDAIKRKKNKEVEAN
jgi:AcrR family transcriptional regulator